MTGFAAKASPTDDKLRGGYYTPAPIAQFVGEWVAQSGSRLLEPSCGDGSILGVLAKHSTQTVGVELFPEEATKAARRTGVTVHKADFFEWFSPSLHSAFDGVAGNPPYIRFGHWTEPSRSLALDLMRSQGLRPNKLTNAWVPFIVASVAACRAGGRIGLVVPAEVMQVGYAAELRAFLIASCRSVTVVTFRELVFPGILQEVVLLMAEKGSGPARIQIVEADNALDLQQLNIDADPVVLAPLHEREKWTKYFLTATEIETIRRFRDDDRLSPLAAFASVDVGVVTGRNSFFVMTEAEALQHGVADLTIPLVSRSAQLTGVTYGSEDHLDYSGAGGKARLLDARTADLSDHDGLAAYVNLGEENDVHTGYKCRIRKKWWVVPSIWEADAFMLRQIHTHPRIVANLTGATSTDTVHRLRVIDTVDAAKLATAAMNSVTFAVSEVVGRSYGGGILELEPSEAEELPIPEPSLVTDDLVTKVDELVRAKRIEEAVDLVDQTVLIDKLGFSAAELAVARDAWQTLRGRRMGRGKGKSEAA